MPDPLKHNRYMNRLTSETRARVIGCLVEGCSIRSTVRLTGVSKKCVMRLLVEVGAIASKYQDRAFHNLTCKRLQVDEQWAFCYAKEKNVTPKIAAKNPDAGDIWLWVAIDADTKIVPCWKLGDRDAGVAALFLRDLRQRLADRVQLTTDGHRAYLEAVTWDTMNVDYAMLVKMYGQAAEPEKRYSPAQCIGCKRRTIVGDPDPEHISTSFVERQNLSMRMGNRRYTRLTNAFSRKLENHAAAVALYYFAYNFIKIHRTLRTSPAMAAGVTDRLWEVSDLVALLEAEERGLERAA
jgi:IS1 family transposase